MALVPWDDLDESGKTARLEHMLKSLIDRWQHFRANSDEFEAHDVLRLSGRVARIQRALYERTGEWFTSQNGHLENL